MEKRVIDSWIENKESKGMKREGQSRFNPTIRKLIRQDIREMVNEGSNDDAIVKSLTYTYPGLGEFTIKRLIKELRGEGPDQDLTPYASKRISQGEWKLIESNIDSGGGWLIDLYYDKEGKLVKEVKTREDDPTNPILTNFKEVILNIEEFDPSLYGKAGESFLEKIQGEENSDRNTSASKKQALTYLAKGETYTGDKLNELGYEIGDPVPNTEREYYLVDKEGDNIGIVYDTGNDNYRIEKKLKAKLDSQASYAKHLIDKVNREASTFDKPNWSNPGRRPGGIYRSAMKKKGEKVTGDRGVGLYEVSLGKRKKGLVTDTDEIIYGATITKLIDNKYDYKVGDEVFVVKNGEGVIWGTIDPFIEDDNDDSPNGKEAKMNIKAMLTDMWDKGMIGDKTLEVLKASKNEKLVLGEMQRIAKKKGFDIKVVGKNSEASNTDGQVSTKERHGYPDGDKDETNKGPDVGGTSERLPGAKEPKKEGPSATGNERRMPGVAEPKKEPWDGWEKKYDLRENDIVDSPTPASSGGTDKRLPGVKEKEFTPKGPYPGTHYAQKSQWVSVNIPFTRSVGEDVLINIEEALEEKGITFDTGTDFKSRDWELDFSLKGATPPEVMKILKDEGIKFSATPVKKEGIKKVKADTEEFEIFYDDLISETQARFLAFQDVTDSEDLGIGAIAIVQREVEELGEGPEEEKYEGGPRESLKKEGQKGQHRTPQELMKEKVERDRKIEGMPHEPKFDPSKQENLGEPRVKEQAHGKTTDSLGTVGEVNPDAGINDVTSTTPSPLGYPESQTSLSKSLRGFFTGVEGEVKEGQLEDFSLKGENEPRFEWSGIPGESNQEPKVTPAALSTQESTKVPGIGKGEDNQPPKSALAVKCKACKEEMVLSENDAKVWRQEGKTICKCGNLIEAAYDMKIDESLFSGVPKGSEERALTGKKSKKVRKPQVNWEIKY